MRLTLKTKLAATFVVVIALSGTSMFIALQNLGRDGEAKAGGNRRGGVRGAERIVFTFAALGETRKPTALAKRADAIAPAGENLMRIGLVADIPDDDIARRIEHVMQRHGEFDDAEARAQMPARDRYGVDHFRAQFIGDLAEMGLALTPQIRGRLDLIEQWR